MVSLLYNARAAVCCLHSTRRRRQSGTIFLACNINTNTEQLRSQLDQLHSEVENTRAKARSARLRLMRLSEAAEKLQRQAAVSVQTGKENDARELLFQKKKVLQALEMSKNRIKLLDELAAKLNEAISVKETELISNIAVDPEIGTENSSSPVWIVSPKEDDVKSSKKNADMHINSLEIDGNIELDFSGWSQANLNSDNNIRYGAEETSKENNWSESDLIHTMRGFSSYLDFQKHLDQQLTKIEVEAIAVLRFSKLVLEAEEEPNNPRVQQITEILESVRRIRERIASIIQSNAESTKD
ncbi:hypothetical protein RJ641_016399 [Dillenia turbinata]|uniref:Uncharacterized protein n=1 Tax=Dillenia turbinata TaxID=194707 RepID=A0AAN8UWA9_9MAGN